MRLLGLDETEIASTMEQQAGLARTCIDVGAADGWYTLHFASRPGVERVLAFEPQADLREELRRNVSLNDEALMKKVVARSDCVGNRDAAGWCRLDDLIPELGRGVVTLKIDIDGGEVEALEGARRLLTERSCRLIVETHSKDLERRVEEFLRDCSYKTQVVKNGWYRAIVPEQRPIAHNRWLVAEPLAR
jgi:hypothetical protein